MFGSRFAADHTIGSAIFTDVGVVPILELIGQRRRGSAPVTRRIGKPHHPAHTKDYNAGKENSTKLLHRGNAL